MTKIKEVIEKELKKIDEKKYEITITHSDGNISINLLKIMRKCFICKHEFPIESLYVRQDDRVTGLFLSKRFCKNHVYKVDFILKSLKPTIPQFLKFLK
jgi:hypothetical protein